MNNKRLVKLTTEAYSILTETRLASCWYYLALFLVRQKEGNKQRRLTLVRPWKIMGS